MRCRRCNTNAECSLVKAEDHNEIEYHVYHAGNREKEQGAHRVTHRAEHGGTVVVDHICRHAHKIGLHIGYGLVKDCLLGSHENEQRLCHNKAEDRNDDAQNCRGDYRGVNDCVHTVVALGTNGVCHTHSCTKRKTHKEVDDEIDERATGANGSEGVFTLVGGCSAPTSHHNGVGGVEQQMQNTCGDQGKGKENNARQNRTFGKVAKLFG